MSSPSFIKNLMKDGLVYGITRYVGVLGAIFLTPIYTRMIPRYDYGIMDIFNVWIAFYSLLIPVGLIQALPRLWMDSGNNKVELKNIMGNFNMLIVFFSAAFLVLSFLMKPVFEHYILQSTDYGNIYYLIIFIAVLQVIYTSQLAVLRQVFDRKSYVTVSLLNLIVLTSLGFVLVYYFHFGIHGFFWASCSSFLIAVLISLWINREYLLLRFDRSRLISMLKYATPLLYVAIFFSLSDITDRWIVNHYLGTKSVGLYSVAAKIASIPLFFTTAFATAWFPRIFSIKEEEERNRLLIKTNNIALLFFGTIFILVILFRSELIWFFAPSYDDAFTLIALLSLSYIISGLGPIYTVGIHLKKTTGDLFTGAIISVLVNVVLSIILLIKFGIEGVAVGTLLGAFIWTWLRYRYGQKHLKLKFNFKDLALLIPAVLVILFSGVFMPQASINLFFLRIIFGLVFLYLVYRRIRPHIQENVKSL